ncbi:hypothetical protein VP01_9506g1 [Puccinia sorghi]|uniref:Uncharacterized protein n=1 Tax=Puccinia sorghi TaxID=27349 RepID=A0A0L6U6G7_9BASI|nr:hypothetical protein VP01_9506g1 [Puccinia sorghi]
MPYSSDNYPLRNPRTAFGAHICACRNKSILLEDIAIRKQREKPPPTRALYKRKAPPAAEETKYIKLPSDKGKIDIKWHIQNLNVSEFKSHVFRAIRIQDTPELGDNAKELDKHGMITWGFSVPHGGPFAAKN